MATNGSLTEPFGFRRNLFTDESGSPMKFSMRPCEERTRLRPVIEHGGGILTSKSSSGTIRLAEPGCRVLSENCYSTRYVWECAMTNHLLAMQDYKAQQNRPVEGSDISETDSFVSRGVRVSQRKIRGRREYYVGDDQAILDFIIKTRRHAEIKGTALWKDMERRKVLQGRTWQSLKERFLKQILPSISSYSLSLDEIRRFRVPFSNEKERYVSEDNCSTDDEVNEGFMVSNGSGTEDENLRKPQKYLTNEDMAIIRYILQDGDNLSLVSGNNLWKEMGFTKVTSHSWQSMKERFHKRILPNIGSYKIPQKYQKRLQQLIAAFPATAGALNIGNIKKEYVPVEEYESPGSSSCSGVPGSLVNHCEESPASTDSNKIETSGSGCDSAPLTNITRTSPLHFTATEDKYEGVKRELTTENSVNVTHRHLEVPVVREERLQTAVSRNADCVVNGHVDVDLTCPSDGEIHEVVAMDINCCYNVLADAKKGYVKPQDGTKCLDTCPSLISRSTHDSFANGRPVQMGKSTNIDDCYIVYGSDNTVCANRSLKSNLGDKNSEEVEVRIACHKSKKTVNHSPVRMLEMNRIKQTEFRNGHATPSDSHTDHLAVDNNDKLKLNVKLGKDMTKMIEVTEKSDSSVLPKASPGLVMSEQVRHALRCLASHMLLSPMGNPSPPTNCSANQSSIRSQLLLPESSLTQMKPFVSLPLIRAKLQCAMTVTNIKDTEREQLQDSVNEEHRAVEADTESNCSHDSRRVKPRKRMRLLSSSTDGLVEEGKNPATKQKNSGKYSETSRTKRLKRKKESNHVRVTRNSAANISASSHSSPDEHYDKNNELLREASPKNYDEDQLSQSIVVEELNSFQLDIPAVDTQIPSKEMCNPRGHALARRKRKARKSDKISSNVPVSENSDIVTLSDDTELYVSDSEAVVNAAAVLGNEMPNNANMSHECNLRLQTELQLCLELKLTEVDKLLKENHFNWNLALSKIFVETSDSEEM